MEGVYGREFGEVITLMKSAVQTDGWDPCIDWYKDRKVRRDSLERDFVNNNNIFV